MANKPAPTDAIAKFLGKTPLLRDCRLDELFDLAKGARQRPFAAGETLLEAGKPADVVGLLLRGRASLVAVDAASGKQRRVERLQPGSLFGEVGLLLGGANPQAVVADQECDTLLLKKAHLERVLGKNSAVSLALARRIASRNVQMTFLGGGGQDSEVELAQPGQEQQRADGPTPAGPDEIRWVEVGSFDLTPELIGVLPSNLIQRYRLLPLKLGDKKLTVGMVNPLSTEARQQLRRILHTVDPEIVAISSDDFDQAFVRLKLDAAEGHDQLRRGARQQPIIYAVDQDREAQKAKLSIGNEVIGLFDRFLVEALELGASDIHVEPDSTGVKVRFRVHGSLVEREEVIAPSYAAPLLGRIKVLAELDITERRKPQDGRIQAQIGRQELNLRVSTMSVARGEKAVIRIIDTTDVMRPLRQIFAQPQQLEGVEQALAEPYGAVIVAGPTGSGKSSTLYSMLNERRRARPDTAIVTVEDPVEYLLPGVTQVPINPRMGFDFATALYGLMRQDPDVIMIGELRDGQTTSIMVEAALTGHLVLTSIHGNNVAAVIQRLQHLGTDPVLLSQALSIIVVQRLAKRLCSHCVKDGPVAPALLNNLVARRIVNRAGTIKLPRPTGCDVCKQTGYSGRVAIQEIMAVDDVVRAAIADGAKPDELVEAAAKQHRFTSFAQSAAFLMARRSIAPSDALLVVSG